ncbi:5-methylcytosine restriction system specificity protein McrC [Thermovibrio sp.]
MSKVLTKFEHQLIEKDELSREGWEELQEVAERERFRFKLRKKGVKLSSHIGLISLSDGTVIEILPKIYHSESKEEGRRLATLLMVNLIERNLRRLKGVAGAPDLKVPFLELVMYATLLYAERKIVIPGIYRSYERRQLLSRSLSGRVLVSKNLTRNPFNREKLFIERELLTADVPVNRLLLKVAELVGKRATFKKLKSLAGRIILYLKNLEVGNWPAGESPGRIRLNRMNAHYEPVVELAKLLEEGRGRGRRGGAITWLYNMDFLFERLISTALPESEYQREFPVGEGFKIRPDILFKDAVIDAKWKRVDEIPNNDCFQVISYAYLLEKRFGRPIRKALLVYPEIESREQLTWDIGEGKELTALNLNMREIMESISRELPLDEQLESLRRKVREKLLRLL